MLYRFDKESLLFKKSYQLIKYRIVLSITLLLFAGTLISAISVTKEKQKLQTILEQKEQRLKFINTPLRENRYLEDVVESIGYNFAQKEIKKINIFISNYRNIIEESQIPITMVIWIAYKESNFNYKAKNKLSSSKGMFGFIDSTWNSMCKLKGVGTEGRYNEKKQVEILITYLNYLYNRHKDWEKVMRCYQGQQQLYPTNFLFK